MLFCDIVTLILFRENITYENTRKELYHMTDKEMARLVVAERLIEGEITIKGCSRGT
ncbi:MAG: hypothetical protein MUO59_00585 [Actinobacteria bacterium]|nr:hypothetical protein [Actinomycetota bacterium]